MLKRIAIVLIGILWAGLALSSPNEDVGTWKLVLTEVKPLPDHYLAHRPGIQMNDVNSDNPEEFDSNYTVSGLQPGEYVESTDLSPPECVNGNPQTNGCDYLKLKSNYKVNDNTIHVHWWHNGGRGVFTPHVYLNRRVEQVDNGSQQSLKVGQRFMVTVPADATSAVLLGSIRNVAYAIDLSDPTKVKLSDEDKKHFAFAQPPLSIPKDHPLETIYVFQVLDPQ